MQTRREFIKTSMAATGGLMLGGLALDSKIYARSKQANDKVRVGIIGFSDRGRASLYPTFMANAEELGFEIVAVSDIWSRRREEAKAYFKNRYDLDVKLFRNNEELYESGMCDAVIISTADFQHALHLVEAHELVKDLLRHQRLPHHLQNLAMLRFSFLQCSHVIFIYRYSLFAAIRRQI